MGNDLAPILVTGAAGYLGGHVLVNLREKRMACAATSRDGSVGEPCDLTRAEAVRALLDRIKPSAVIHCAAIVPKSAAGYEDGRAADASLAMVKVIAAMATCPVILASSMTVYTGAEQFPVREESVPRLPPAGYAHGKWSAEQSLFARNFPGDTALRFPGLFGAPRRSGLLYNAAKSFLARGEFEAAAPSGIWAAMDVRDAAEYAVRAAAFSSKTTPQPVNVGYEGEFSVLTAVAEIAAQCNVAWKPPVMTVRPFSMCLDRLKDRYGALSVTFRQRIAELIDVVRDDLLRDGIRTANAR